MDNQVIIDSLEEAFALLDTAYATFPNDAILYLQQHPDHAAIQAKIVDAIANIYDDSKFDETLNDFHEGGLWYGVVAEAEQFWTEAVADAIIAYFTNESIDKSWDTASEQFIFVLEKISLKNPKYVVDKVMEVLLSPAAKKEETKADLMYLYYVLQHEYTAEAYFDEILDLLEDGTICADAFASTLIYLDIHESVPVLYKILKACKFNPKKPEYDLECKKYGRVLIGEILNTIEHFQKNKPRPTEREFYSIQRPDWQTYYAEYENWETKEDERGEFGEDWEDDEEDEFWEGEDEDTEDTDYEEIK